MTNPLKIPQNELWAKYYETDPQSLAAFDFLCAIAQLESIEDPTEPVCVNHKDGKFCIGDPGPDTAMSYSNGVVTRSEPRFIYTYSELQRRKQEMERKWVQALSTFPLSEAAQIAQMEYSTLHHKAGEHGIKFATRNKERNAAIALLVAAGTPRKVLAEAFSVSLTAISKIVSRGSSDAA